MERILKSAGENVKPISSSFKWWEIFKRPTNKIEITIETKKTLKMRRLKTRVTQYCPDCAEDTFFLSINEARDVFRGEAENLESLVAGEKLHLRVSANNEKRICFNSLRNQIEEN